MYVEGISVWFGLVECCWYWYYSVWFGFVECCWYCSVWFGFVECCWYWYYSVWFGLVECCWYCSVWFSFVECWYCSVWFGLVECHSILEMCVVHNMSEAKFPCCYSSELVRWTQLLTRSELPADNIYLRSRFGK